MVATSKTSIDLDPGVVAAPKTSIDLDPGVAATRASGEPGASVMKADAEKALTER